MKFLLRISFLLVIISCFSLSYPDITTAAVDLPWSTTYDCNDWTQSDGLSVDVVNCDGLAGSGAWTCSGEEEMITSAANNPNGNGGKGQRHWEGDGSNINSGGLSIEFSSLQPEIWIRWDMRYEENFQWSGLVYDKWLYIHTNESGKDAIPEWAGSDSASIYAQGASGHHTCDNCGWNKVMGKTTSDGQWHSYEVHLKVDTNGSNGIAEMWIDEELIISYNNVDYGTHSGFSWILIGSNQSSPNNGRCMAVDYDDIAINNTGYIGPLTDTISPSSPENLK